MRRYLTWKGLGLAVLTMGLMLPPFASAGFCPIPAVPEIDPSVAQSALTVLVGGVLVLLGRRQRV